MSRISISRTKLSLLAVLIASSAAQATILEKIDFDTLCGGAARVVLARAVEGSSAWDAPHRTILTTTRFEVKETLKGSVTGSIDVTTLGGVVGKEAMGVAGSPSFRQGEEYVLFLDATPAGGWMCKGWTQGRYEVLTDSQTGQKSVRGDTTGAGLAKRGAGKIEEGGPGDSMPLAGFLDSVRSRVAPGGGK